MEHAIRPFVPGDADAVVDLALRAWEPVFASMRQVLGDSIFVRLYGDWREHQEDDVRRSCARHEATTWVASVDGRVGGFAVVALHDGSPVGEVLMLAVDPADQGSGIGGALIRFAVERIRDAGKTLAMVETGGDPGHESARRTYARAGLTPMPIVRYFKAL